MGRFGGPDGVIKQEAVTFDFDVKLVDGSVYRRRDAAPIGYSGSESSEGLITLISRPNGPLVVSDHEVIVFHITVFICCLFIRLTGRYRQRFRYQLYV